MGVHRGGDNTNSKGRVSGEPEHNTILRGETYHRDFEGDRNKGNCRMEGAPGQKHPRPPKDALR